MKTSDGQSGTRQRASGVGPIQSDGVRNRILTAASLLACAICALLLPACQQEMADQPRYKPLSKSEFFEDNRSARPLVEGTVARGQLRADEGFYTGKVNGKLVEAFPFPTTRTLLQRGQERFNIYCSPCHDRLGTGMGMVVRRGYYQPPSYHSDRLRAAPPGYLFEIITNGFGVMPSYAEQVSPADRWAIIAYIRALQLSQHAPVASLPEAARRELESKP